MHRDAGASTPVALAARRVTHVITHLQAGGAERMLLKLLASMDTSRYTSRVVSLMGEGTIAAPLRKLGIPVDAMGCRRGIPSLAALNRLRRILRDDPPDVLQGWMYHGNLAAQIGRTMAGLTCPLIWNVRHTPGEFDEENVRTSAAVWLSARLSSRVTAIVYNSSRSAERHEQLGFVKRSRKLIHNGFDLMQFAPRPEARAELRNELGFPETALLIGHIAHFSPMKDHATFLAAADRVAKTHPEARFVLAGMGVDDSNETLAGQVATYGLGDRVRLLGERRDVHRWLPALDIVVSSSAFGEGFMNVIGEAMACGVPCVVSDVGESAHIVGDTGITVPPRRPSELAEGITRILCESPQARAGRGDRARARIAQNFSLQSIADEYQELYDAVMRSSRDTLS